MFTKLTSFTQCLLWRIALATLLLVGSGLPSEAKYRPGWNKVRQSFLRGVMNDPRQPKFIRGGLRGQVIRWQRAGKSGLPRLKNPKGYDIGHNPMKRGSLNIKDLRLELTNDNRSRPQRAKARARKRGGVANFF
jgi:hypothetical protein